MMLKLNISKILGTALFAGLVFTILLFIPVFSNVAEAAGCARPSCAFNGQCYANGTTYGNYRCSDGNIVQIIPTNSTPVPENCARPSCAYNGRCYANGTTYGGYSCSNGDITEVNGSSSGSNTGSNSGYVSSRDLGCPFSSSANRTVVVFATGGNNFFSMRADAGQDRAIRDFSVSLPAGTYNVSLFGYDSRDSSAYDNQPQEKFYVSLRNGSTEIARSNSTSDLQDGVSLAQWSGMVNSNLEVGSAVNTVTVIHPAYHTSNPNSLQAKCAAFDLISTPPPPAPTLSGSCSVNPSTANINQTVNWSASASGGNGSYTYAWFGNDGLSGNSNSISKTYSSAGTKMGTVTITSGSQSINRNCSVVVSQAPAQNLTATCSVNPSSVNVNGYLNWNATASGGNGSYTYSWNGTDGLTGNSSYVSKSYNTSGLKIGTVTVTSGNQSVSSNCSANVTEVINNDLSISCNASQSNVDIDQNMTWYANASGGTGSYTYSWNGTSGLNGNSRNLSWSYNSTGVKVATITITSGSRTASASCTTNVNDNYQYDENLSVSCYANQNNIQVGNQIYWRADVSGGNGDYDYYWYGTDGLNSYSQSAYMTYYNSGSKSATVTVHDNNGHSASRTCYANVNQTQNTVLAYSQSYQPPMESAVYLSQVPYTGVADNVKLYFFVGMMALFSAWMAYIVISYKKEKGELN